MEKPRTDFCWFFRRDLFASEDRLRIEALRFFRRRPGGSCFLPIAWRKFDFIFVISLHANGTHHNQINPPRRVDNCRDCGKPGGSVFAFGGDGKIGQRAIKSAADCGRPCFFFFFSIERLFLLKRPGEWCPSTAPARLFRRVRPQAFSLTAAWRGRMFPSGVKKIPRVLGWHEKRKNV